MHSLPNAKIKMASDRFVQLSEAAIKTFPEEHENVNTKKTTLNDSKIIQEVTYKWGQKERTSRNSCRRTTAVRDKVCPVFLSL